MKRGPNFCIIALILCLMALSLISGEGSQAQQTAVAYKIVLQAGDSAARQALMARNARLIVDYGAFSLWTVIDQDLEALARTSSRLSVCPEFDQLWLREGIIDTLKEVPGDDALAGVGRQLHLVQFVGPVRDEWLADLKSTGAQIVAYVPYNGYVIWADEDARAQIARRVAERTEYQWHGPYWPAYRLAASLRELDASEQIDVVVQVVNHAEARSTVQEILDRSEAVLRGPYILLNYVCLGVRVPGSYLSTLAAQADVFNVEPWPVPRLTDERQGQILAGNLNTDATQPSGPGYLTWLDGLGFSKEPADYPIVDVIDDGFDNGSATAPGHPDFYRLGSASNASRVVYARVLIEDGHPESVGGHGTLNASIVGGYNNKAGSAYEDTAGYQYGLGISPYGRLGSSKVFDDQGSWAYYGSLPDLIRGAYQSGARITNNSWGLVSDPRYDSYAQEFDALTRDADAGTPGNQEMIHVVSAGNEGPASNTVESPGTAKNVITVGASENYRPTGTDGCWISNDAANNAQDVASLSSRGPTADGRVKPDVVAPGTHVQGAASQDPDYDGNNVCDPYWPTGQTLYTWSSGTSHATPAVAGALSLIHVYLSQHGGGDPPSSAMLKAYLLNSARYINGAYAGGDLPSNDQGWGRANLGMAFDGVARMLVDQGVLLSDSGQIYEMAGVVEDPSKPLRVTLAWTDAPAATTGGAAWVNDLDLEVIVGGQTYKGNVFDGSTSVAGGATDAVNNVESVFLPAGTSDRFTVHVTAANVAGDGVPGNGDASDQDFALVVYNAASAPDFGLRVSPASGLVCGAGQVAYTVSVSASLGYAHTVSLAYSTPPPDVQVTLSPISGVPSYEAILSATTSDSTAVGLYTLVLTGTGEGGHTHTATATLAVDVVAPAGPVTLISPTNGIANVATRPMLTWGALPYARTYRVQVAGNETFTALAVDQEVSTASYQLASDLQEDTTYYWRVTAQNGCGSSVSPSWVFTTVRPVRLFYDSMEWDGDRWNVETVVGTARWTWSDIWSYSGAYAWQMPSEPSVTDARLAIARQVTVDETSTLSFWHWYDMESAGETAYDGGVLEISVDGGGWQDLASHILSGGYGHKVSTKFGNPLGGRSAWSGDSDGWRQVVVDLSAFAGSSVRIRFRWGADESTSGAYAGWYVDDVEITSIWPPSKFKLYLSAIYAGP